MIKKYCYYSIEENTDKPKLSVNCLEDIYTNQDITFDSSFFNSKANKKSNMWCAITYIIKCFFLHLIERWLDYTEQNTETITKADNYKWLEDKYNEVNIKQQYEPNIIYSLLSKYSN